MTRSFVWPVMASLALGGLMQPAAAREIVDASAPIKTSVTVYRDPERDVYDEMDRDLPKGFAMISETRRVTLPPGVSTIRFTGVAEGMVAVSAIVTGLPGGTIEKNRNAELLSPAALVNGMLGNRITVTRTNPATGEEVSESGIVRTRADGGLVLQTEGGFEAVRCSGLPEKLTFPSVPDGLSPSPVFTIDTRDVSGGTYDITLSYLAWGFDWQAHYVATLTDGAKDGQVSMNLLSWLTILNDNNQTFANAELMAVAGSLNIESDFEDLAEPPRAAPLRLTCYPFGSTAAGSPITSYPQALPAPPPPAMEMMADGYITVTASRMKATDLQEAPAMVATEEALGDLKLYRVPEPVSVNAQGQKQVAFLNKEDVKGEFVYQLDCRPYEMMDSSGPRGAFIILETRNDKKHGLGIAMPMGGFTLFEPSSAGELLVAEESLWDHAVGQDIEIELGGSSQVRGMCARLDQKMPDDGDKPSWTRMKASLTNANPWKVKIRLDVGYPSQWEVNGLRGTRLKNGNRIVEITLPANGTRELAFRVRPKG